MYDLKQRYSSMSIWVGSKVAWTWQENQKFKLCRELLYQLIHMKNCLFGRWANFLFLQFIFSGFCLHTLTECLTRGSRCRSGLFRKAWWLRDNSQGADGKHRLYKNNNVATMTSPIGLPFWCLQFSTLAVAILDFWSQKWPSRWAIWKMDPMLLSS